jgi:hypothetical protein
MLSASVKNVHLSPTQLKFGNLTGRLANSGNLRNFSTPLDSFDLAKSRSRSRIR